MKRLILAATALVALAGVAKADTVFTTNFTIDGCSSTCGPAGTVFGSVTLTDTAFGVDFDVKVLNGNKFNWNGQGHNTFSFSLNKTITAADVTIQTAGYQFELGGMEGTFGTFKDDVDHGANGTGNADIMFTVKGIDFNNFIKSTNGHPSVFFAIDVVGTNGKTGVIGSEFSGGVIEQQVAAVPEPATWAMLLMGFAGVGFVAYRRKQGGPAFRMV